MTNLFILNKGRKSEIRTFDKERVDFLLNECKTYKLSETVLVCEHRDFAGIKAVGKSFLLRQNISGIFNVSEQWVIKKEFTTTEQTVLPITLGNIDKVLNIIYGNNSRIKKYKTISGAKKYIKKILS